MKRAIGIFGIFFLVSVGLVWMGYRWAVGGPALQTPAKAPAESQFVTIDLSGIANTTILNAFSQTPGLPGEAGGVVTLGGVPFYFVSGSNCWWCVNVGDSPTVEIPVKADGATCVDTLMNTLWGRQSFEAATLEFFGDQGAYCKKVLVGGVDLRDWNDSTYVNTINNTTTTRVWAGHGEREPPFDRPARMDKQRIELPPEFRTQRLTKITLTDSGSNNVSRIILYGLTVTTSGHAGESK